MEVPLYIRPVGRGVRRVRSHPPSLHRPGTLLEDHDDQQALEKNTGSQMLKNCEIKLSLWHKKISFEVKKSEINVLQNAPNAVSARQPNFPPRYLYLRPCLVRRLVGSHPPVKKKKLATVLYISYEMATSSWLPSLMIDTTRREWGQRAEDMFL